MKAVVWLSIGGKQVRVDSETFQFTWVSPEGVNTTAFNELLAETFGGFGQVYFPQMLVSDIEVDKMDNVDRIRVINLVQVLNALWWVGKEKNIRVRKLSSTGVSFEFKEPNFSVDEYVR